MDAADQYFQSLPKVELHVHLDCSLSYEVVKRINPQITQQYYTQNFIGPPMCHNLNDYLARAEYALQLMQEPHHLQWAVEDLYKQFKNENVIYAEIRFSPLLHTRKKMTPEEVVDTVLEASERSKAETGIEGGVIICTLRHYNREQSDLTARLACQHFGKGVVGFDIASDEAGYPLDAHIQAFEIVQNFGIPCTAHAGEARGVESVWETLYKLQPSRLGHGVRSAEDQVLLDHLKEKDIHLEICPTSNIQTRAIETMEVHPVAKMFQQGISLSINTDARTISNTSCTEEYKKLHKEFNWGFNEIFKCNMEAIDHAFTSIEIKTRIKNKLKQAYSDKNNLWDTST